MWKNLFIWVLLFIFALSFSFAQNVTAGTEKKSPIPGPVMKKGIPAAPTTVAVTKSAPKALKSAVIQDHKKNVITEVQKKVDGAKKSRPANTSFIYPPYTSAWEEKWTQGTGYISSAQAMTDGCTYHSGNSYAWGMASSRCWVGLYYTPTQTGWYEVKLDSYQEGALDVALNGQGEVYAYRNLGIWIENLGYESKTIEDIYFNTSVGRKTKPFKGWCYVSKEYYLEAGKTYWLAGYSEIGGWSSGNENDWQMTNATCGLAPFSIRYLRK